MAPDYYLEDEREVGVERLFQLLGLRGGHLVAREVKDLQAWSMEQHKESIVASKAQHKVQRRRAYKRVEKRDKSIE